MPRPPTPNPEAVCGVKKRGKEEWCTLRAGQGTSHLGFGPCSFHRGNSTVMKAKYDPQAEAWKVNRAAATYGIPREVDPFTALEEELYRTAGIVQWLQEAIGAIEERDVTHLIVTNAERDGESKLEVIDERANELIKLYQVERKHFRDIAKTCIDVGIDVRKMEIAELQAQLFNTALRAILTDLGVIDHPEVLTIVRKHLSVAAVASSG